MNPFLSVITFSIFTSFLLRLLIPAFSKISLDIPNIRSSHKYPIPRGGGLIFVLVSSIACIQQLLTGSMSTFVDNSAILIAFPLAVVGFFDDRFNLPVGLRYGVQLITAFFLISVSPLPLPLPWLCLPFLLILSTAVINFTNFMDGLDGLVAGCMALAIGGVSFSLNASLSYWALVGSLLGFIYWNWQPAKVFMGDVGSTFLGAVFIGLVFQSASWTQAMSCFLVGTPLFADACSCVLRRFCAGQPVFKGHRLHLYQRLNQAGWSHARVSLIYFLATALLLLNLILADIAWVFISSLVVFSFGIWLDQCVAVPFNVASKG